MSFEIFTTLSITPARRRSKSFEKDSGTQLLPQLTADHQYSPLATHTKVPKKKNSQQPDVRPWFFGYTCRKITASSKILACWAPRARVWQTPAIATSFPFSPLSSSAFRYRAVSTAVNEWSDQTVMPVTFPSCSCHSSQALGADFQRAVSSFCVPHRDFQTDSISFRQCHQRLMTSCSYHRSIRSLLLGCSFLSARTSVALHRNHENT